MFQRLEEMNRMVWGDKVTLATTAHALGGMGIGLLINRATAERLKPLAYTLIAFSTLAHLYAFLTMPTVPLTMGARERFSDYDR